MTNAIVPTTTEMPVGEIAQAFVKSGYFQDSKDVSQAIVKILAGREFGFGAFSSMTGIYIIQGRPAMGANLLASAVKRSARYDYRVREMTDQRCDVEFFERSGGKLESLGHSVFTLDDARKAQTKNLDKFPRNMLFARAISNGVRWYTPDVFGAAVYTPEELGATVNEDGEVIDVIAQTPHQKPPTDGNGSKPFHIDLEDAMAMTTPKGARLDSLTVEQLDVVINATKHQTMKIAAEVVRDYKLATMPVAEAVEVAA